MLVGIGPYVLSWFGPDFPLANDALRIMVAGQVFNAAFGSVVLLLIMTGNTRYALPGLLVAAIAQAALGCALIPHHGAVGAAWASATGTVVWNLLLAVAVFVRLGVDPSVLGRRRVAHGSAAVPAVTPQSASDDDSINPSNTSSR